MFGDHHVGHWPTFLVTNIMWMYVGALYISLGIELILSRLASVEAQQRVHTQMMQTVISTSARWDRQEACDLPQGIKVPLTTLRELQQTESKLEDTETKLLLVNYAVYLFNTGLYVVCIGVRRGNAESNEITEHCNHRTCY